MRSVALALAATAMCSPCSDTIQIERLPDTAGFVEEQRQGLEMQLGHDTKRTS